MTQSQGSRSSVTPRDPKKSEGNVPRKLVAVVTILFTLIGEAPFVVGSIAPTLGPKVSRQTSYRYVQFFGQRWHLVVGYQGSEKIFDYNPDWTVKIIRERAILAFRLTECQPPLSLFNLSGVELPDTASTDAAGINSGDHLVLGPSKANSGTIIGCRASFMWRAAPIPRGVIQEWPVPGVRVIRCTAPGAAQKIPTERNSATDAQHRSRCTAPRVGPRIGREQSSASNAPRRSEPSLSRQGFLEQPNLRDLKKAPSLSARRSNLATYPTASARRSARCSRISRAQPS